LLGDDRVYQLCEKFILLQGRLKRHVATVNPIVTQERAQYAKSSADILFDELDDHLGIIGKGSNRFRPLGE